MKNIKRQIMKMEGKWYWPKYGSHTWATLNDLSNHKDIIVPLLKNTNVMVQAGGNCGFVLAPFVDVFTRIYTFEPDPINFYCLNLNLPYINVNKIQACVGSNNNCVNIKNNYDNDNGAFYVTKGTTIPTIRIDDLNLHTCDLIMLDVEGYEYNTLKGAVNTIKRCRPLLCVEFFEEWLNRAGASIIQLEEFIISMKYEYVCKYGSDRIYKYKE